MPGHECIGRSCVLTSLVKKYEQWKNSSYLFVGFGESPFLQSTHVIPLGPFSLYSSFMHSWFSPCSLDLWSQATLLLPHPLVLLFFSFIRRLKETPSTPHVSDHRPSPVSVSSCWAKHYRKWCWQVREGTDTARASNGSNSISISLFLAAL